MGIRISYMGTKRAQAEVVAAIIKELPSGPLLDAFAGMCAVGEAVAPQRNVWTNDVQPFPAAVGRALFCSQTAPMRSQAVGLILESSFSKNLRMLRTRFADYLAADRRYLRSRRLRDLMAAPATQPFIGNDRSLQLERKRLHGRPSTFPYRLATITYVGGFFGAQQCMEIDSIRYAMDVSFRLGAINEDQRTWLIIALCQVLCHINNSTGQFAHYLKPNAFNFERIIAKRRRSVWSEFLVAIDTLKPIDAPQWRKRNRSFCKDALELLQTLGDSTVRPKVIYADPPYSSAQYSRYYHVLDSILDYRYPEAQGVGRYPGHRFQTPFAQASLVKNSLTELIRGSSETSATLVLSYPRNGLYTNRGGNLRRLLEEYYSHVEIAYSGIQNHSTFGGRGVSPKVPVVERIYVASN
jgi:adenine-specific DNA-methyltransferase